ncbi:glycosyltransferase family 2 protein [Vagococcus fluvialis]|uniref:glycosyltransferase family 2 protein n=1 Tax=Vagococcus fluvialis TaxID=2738 RepID=UPI003791C44A
MESSYEISVIIPVYNEENNIEKLIQKLEHQTFKNFEIVIVNDGSKDNTEIKILQQCEKFSNIRYYKNLNSGVGFSRNYGVKKSKGRFVTFLDADDYYDDRFLELMYNNIQEKNADVCFCGHNIVTPIGERKAKTFFSKKNVLENYILGNLKLHTDSWLINKEIILNNNVLFLEKSNWGEDFYFFCKLLSLDINISFLNKYLTFYTHDFTDDRLSRNTFDKLPKDVELIEDIITNLEVVKGDRIYEILLNYRLPTMLINRLLGYPSNDQTINYVHMYSPFFLGKKYFYGIPSLKQIIRLTQLRFKFRYWRR